MIGTFTVLNGNTKITFEVTAPTQTVQDVVGDAAEWLWVHGYGNHGTPESPIDFDDLTNQQKLDMVADHIQIVILDLANTFKAVKAASDARDLENANKYQF